MDTPDSPRAGRYLGKPGAPKSFAPVPLRPGMLRRDSELDTLLSAADRAIGRLDGAAAILPNADLFVAMYSRKEALLSSQIEGTHASLVDVLEQEAEPARPARPDVQEVLNHQAALHYGLARLAELPLSNRLLKEMHGVLMRDVRGGRSRVEEFRRTQNWIGPAGATIDEAVFVPPDVPTLHRAMGELERWLHDDTQTPLLLKCGLAHYQFETIHPFEDGNGRLGRLLITLMLIERQVLAQPLLYLSVFFKRHRADYYAWLNRVRDEGDYEGWLKFFLRGVRDVSVEATDTAQRILAMRNEHLELVQSASASRFAPMLLEGLLEAPAMTAKNAAKRLGVSYQTANTLIADLEKLGLLREITGGRRNRVFLYPPYIERLGGRFEP